MWSRNTSRATGGAAPAWAVPCAAVGLALAVRLLGIRLGLPYFHHWDECWIADSATKMLRTRDSQPDSYQYGAPLAALTAALFRGLQALEPKHAFDWGDGVILRVLSRLVTAVISSTGAAGVYVAARYAGLGGHAGRVRGAYAAFLYATAAELVSHGRYGVTDADLVALVAWSLACSALFLRSGAVLWAAGAVLFAALAFSFKVTALTALAIPALALFLRPVVVPRMRWPAIGRMVDLAAIPAALAVFLALNPHLVLHWQDALKDIKSRADQMIDGGFPQFLLRKPGWEHLGAVVVGLGTQALHRWEVAAVVAAVLGLGGLARAIAQRSRLCVVAAVHAVVAILPIVLRSQAFLFRNYLVALPALCVGFGFAAEALSTRLPPGGWRRLPRPRVWLAGAFALVYVAVPVGQAIMTQQMSLDARTRAVNWIAQQAVGKTVSVACTPDIISNGSYTSDGLREGLKRAGLSFVSDVKTAADARGSRADYIVVVSHPDPLGDRGDMWPFKDVPTYHRAAAFDANPYEHRYDITATWAGRFSVIVLERGKGHGA